MKGSISQNGTEIRQREEEGGQGGTEERTGAVERDKEKKMKRIKE